MLNDLSFKRFKHKSVVKQTVLLALTVIVLLNCLSCLGKRKPPLPPVERIPQRVEITGFQRGDSVILSWKMPARNAKSKSLLNISSLDIYRLAEPFGSAISLSEEDFANRSTLIKNLPVTANDFGLKTLTYTDHLEFANQAVRLRYAIRLVNSSGQKAAFSNFLLIEPTAKLSKAPTSLSTSVLQDGIELSWTEPDANIDGSKPVNILGYNVYRATSKKETAKILNKTPVKDTTYEDKFFEFNKEYFYFVRSVSVGSNGEPVESLESNIAEIKPIDTFAPSAPTAITIAAAPGTISIFFAINPEKDIAGYKIYRSEDPGVEKAKWDLLTPEMIMANSYQDKRVEPGKAYHYYITATDTAGNVSDVSEIVSETAP
jgi:fibronectin type 3 domain-containing protein